MKKYIKKIALPGLMILGAVSLSEARVQITTDSIKGRVTIVNNTPLTAAIAGWRFLTDAPITKTPVGIGTVIGSNVKYDSKNYHQLFLTKGAGNPGLLTSKKDLFSDYPWPTTGIPNCSFPGAGSDMSKDGNCEALISTGSCNEPLAYNDADAIELVDLPAIMGSPEYYDENHRYLDSLGLNGGKYSGGWIDTYYGQTQFIFAIPEGTVNLNQVDKFDETKLSTLGWMAPAMIQEIFNGDNQWMFAIGFKETNHGLTHHIKETNKAGNYSPFHVEGPTFVDRALSYVKYYPYHSCFTKSVAGTPVDATVAVTNCGFADIYDIAAKYNGDNSTTTDEPFIVNQWISSWLTWDVNYAILANLNTIEFARIIGEAKEKRTGICAMAPIYNVGYWGAGKSVIGTFQGADAVINNPKACNMFPMGNNNYRDDVLMAVGFITEANKKSLVDPSVKIVDRFITKKEVKQFYFGASEEICPADAEYTNPNGGSVKGGMMMHFKLGKEKCNEMWKTVEAGFDIQAKKWGGDKISLRYDWLTNLRLGKFYIDKTRPNINASIGDAALIIAENQGNGTLPDGSVLDRNFPFIEIDPVVVPLDDGGYEFTVEVLDNTAAEDKGVKNLLWTANDDWSGFTSKGVVRILPADASIEVSPTATYKLTISKATFDSWNGETRSIWFRGIDGCGNSVTNRALIKGVTLPTLKSAEITSSIPDGKGRKVDVILDPDDDADLKWDKISEVVTTWPNSTDSIKVNYTITGSVLSFEFDAPVAGSGSGDVIVKWSNGITIQVGIVDRVGPVINSAYYLGDKKEELVLSFSEKINGLTDQSLKELIRNVETGQGITVDTVISKGASLIFVVNKDNPVVEGDSIHILVSSVDESIIVDLAGNYAHPKNYGVRVIEYTGPALLEKEGNFFAEKDVNGILDLIQLRFNRGIDAGSASQMTLTFKWKDSTGVIRDYSVKKFEIDPQDAQNIIVDLTNPETFEASDLGKLAPFTTSFDITKQGWGTVELSQPLPGEGDTVQTPTMEDRMEPVIEKAVLRSNSSPESRPTKLELIISEPIDFKSLKSEKALFNYQSEGAEKSLPQASVEWVEDRRMLRIVFDPEMEKPNISDSVKILSDAINDGLVQDVNGNFATIHNPLVPIEGKQVIQFLGPKLVSLDESKLEGDVFDTIMFLDRTESLDSVVRADGIQGLGFSFTFKDSVDADRGAIKVSYDLNIYDIQGQFVAKVRGDFGCKDIEENRPNGTLARACSPELIGSSRKITAFIPWNARSTNKRLVGSGVYILKATASINKTVASKSTTIYGTSEFDGKIGIVRAGLAPKSVTVEY